MKETPGDTILKLLNVATDKYYIGIDPGVSVGFAVWSSNDKQFKIIKTLTFWTVADIIDALQPKADQIVFVIEDPNLNKPTFTRPGQSIAAMKKISQNVGSNKRDAKLMIDLIRRMKFNFTCVAPRTEKWGVNVFSRITGYTGTTSEHGRDAGRLVFGY